MTATRSSTASCETPAGACPLRSSQSAKADTLVGDRSSRPCSRARPAHSWNRAARCSGMKMSSCSVALMSRRYDGLPVEVQWISLGKSRASNFFLLQTPEVRYARSGSVDVAYQVVGEGPLDLLYIPGWISHLDLYWEEASV